MVIVSYCLSLRFILMFMFGFLGGFLASLCVLGLSNSSSKLILAITLRGLKQVSKFVEAQTGVILYVCGHPLMSGVHVMTLHTTVIRNI